MLQIYPDQGIEELLRRITRPSLRMDLFINNLTPDRDTEYADLTVLSDHHAINDSDWGFYSISGHRGILIASAQVFTNGTGSPISAYGYLVYPAASTELLAVARFDSAPRVIAASGGTTAVIPVLGGFSEQT